jgi:hypothetical protein
MTAGDTSSGDRFEEDLDVFTAEQLFAGGTSDSMSPATDGLAALLGALRQPATAVELRGEVEVVGSMGQVVAAHHGRSAPAGEKADRKMLGKFITTKALGAALGLVLMGGAAAAATGQVPDVWPNSSPPASELPATTAPVASSTTTAPETADGAGDAGEPTTTAPLAETTTKAPSGSTASTFDPTAAGADGSGDAGADASDTGDTGADGVVCADGNHGATVSSVAHDDAVSGLEHGAAVSEAARSDCGKAGNDDGGSGGAVDDGAAPSVEDSTAANHGDDADDGSGGIGKGKAAGATSSSGNGRSAAGDGSGAGEGAARSQTR